MRALHDRCPHRGVPLSHPMATQEWPGTWTCCYHGWTFDLETGTLVAAITDGPDSPICGKVAVRRIALRRQPVYALEAAGPPRSLEERRCGRLRLRHATLAIQGWACIRLTPTFICEHTITKRRSRFLNVLVGCNVR